MPHWASHKCYARDKVREINDTFWSILMEFLGGIWAFFSQKNRVGVFNREGALLEDIWYPKHSDMLTMVQLFKALFV